MMIYNTDLFATAGIAEAPTTWAEMEDAAKKLVALGDDVKAYGMPLGKEEAQVESSLWVWGALVAPGSTVRTSRPTPPAAVEGFAQMKKMFEAGYTQANLEDNRQDTTNLFAAGKPRHDGWPRPGTQGRHRQGHQGQAGPGPLEGRQGRCHRRDRLHRRLRQQGRRTQAGHRRLPRPPVSDALYEGWYKGTSLLPVTKSMIEKGKAEADENNKGFYEALSIVKFNPVSNPQWDALQTALKASAFKVGTEDPATVLKEIQAQVDAQA